MVERIDKKKKLYDRDLGSPKEDQDIMNNMSFQRINHKWKTTRTQPYIFFLQWGLWEHAGIDGNQT